MNAIHLANMKKKKIHSKQSALFKFENNLFSLKMISVPVYLFLCYEKLNFTSSYNSPASIDISIQTPSQYGLSWSLPHIICFLYFILRLLHGAQNAIILTSANLHIFVHANLIQQIYPKVIDRT